MNLLALDTSSNACSVALQVGDEIIEDHVVEPRAHTKLLMPMISKILQDGDTELTDLDAIVLGNGPGSFIGMRIGASVAQGLCFGSGLSVIPVSSLAAIAAEVMAEHEAPHVVVAQDARMNEVYLGCFRKRKGGLPEAEHDEQIVLAGKLSFLNEGSSAAGGGWERYPELKSINMSKINEFVAVECPRARFLLLLAERAPDAIPAEQLAPAYLRSKVAEKPAQRN